MSIIQIYSISWEVKITIIIFRIVLLWVKYSLVVRLNHRPRLTNYLSTRGIINSEGSISVLAAPVNWSQYFCDWFSSGQRWWGKVKFSLPIIYSVLWLVQSKIWCNNDEMLGNEKEIWKQRINKDDDEIYIIVLKCLWECPFVTSLSS